MEVNFEPIFDMAAEYFTYLGIAFMNPGGPKSGTGTPHSVNEFMSMTTDELLREALQEGFGKRKQDVLKALSFKRDGVKCPLTGLPFKPIDASGVKPILGHVIPNSVHGKPDTIKCIGMFAGPTVRDLVVEHLNGLGNVMNLQSDAHQAYDDLEWAIQANRVGGKVTYIFKLLLGGIDHGPGVINLTNGQGIPFGKGPDGAGLEGPLPVLCNLQYAVARVMRMSGAAEVIRQLKDDADDSDFPYVYLASTDFSSILSAKLLLSSGRALYT